MLILHLVKDSSSKKDILYLSSYSWLDLFKLSASTLFLIFIYVAIFLLGMIKIFVYGEANVPEKSASMQRFWQHRKQADNEMKLGHERNQHVRSHLLLAAEALSRPVSVPK